MSTAPRTPRVGDLVGGNGRVMSVRELTGGVLDVTLFCPEAVRTRPTEADLGELAAIPTTTRGRTPRRSPAVLAHSDGGGVR